MRPAARLVDRVQRFGNLSEYMRDVLHWLPPQQRIFFRISSLVWRSVLGRASSYLQVLLTLTSSCLGQPSVCNSLPSYLRSLPRDLSSAIYRSLFTGPESGAPLSRFL